MAKKKNFDDVYLRCVILGLLGAFRDKFTYKNEFETETVDVNVPFFYSLTGDNRYILDSFYDDIAGTRVNGNTDQVPRGHLTLKSWNIKMEEFTNPNVWININKDVDDELIQTATQVKAVPLKLTFNCDILIDHELEAFKIWQILVEGLFMYRYFSFDYKRIPIKAVFNFIPETENPVVRDYKFGDLNVLKLNYTLEIHTFFPIVDYNYQVSTNKDINWFLELWEGRTKLTDDQEEA